MKLSEQQLEYRKVLSSSNRGRQAVIHKPYFTEIPKNTRIWISKYDTNEHAYYVEFEDGENIKTGWVLPDEIQFTDKEFSGFGIEKLGIRSERKDKYGNSLIIEIQNNKRDIQLSQALTSLLNLKGDKNCIGFARDPDSKQYYIFAATKEDGYELDNNNRITSPADARELEKLFGSTSFEVIAESIIDYNHPDIVLYGIRINYSELNNTPKKRQAKAKGGLADYMEEIVKQKPYFYQTYAATNNGIKYTEIPIWDAPTNKAGNNTPGE